MLFVAIVLACASQDISTCTPVAHRELFETEDACREWGVKQREAITEIGGVGANGCFRVILPGKDA